MGPGLTRINSSVLDDPITLLGVKNDLKDMLDQIPQSWDAHTRLEYLKVALPTVIFIRVGKVRKELREEIAELESTLNEMHELKKQACALDSNVEENVNKLALIELY